jgi:hypothetical protein
MEAIARRIRDSPPRALCVLALELPGLRVRAVTDTGRLRFTSP